MAAWTGSQTIIFWEYHTFSDLTRRNLWNQAYGGAGTWTHEQGYNINYFYGNSGTDNIPYTALTSDPTPLGRWNMLTTTRDPSQVKWYINNINTNNQSNPFGVLTLTTTDITIGNGYTGVPWVGNIGAIAAYNKALTQAEVNQVYFQGNIVTGSLVFMVDANNLVSYPKSGTSTYNLTGSQVGTLTNGVGFNSRNGGVFDFDGTDDTISIPYNTEMDPTGGITLEAWIYPEDLTTVVYQEIFRKESGAGRQLFSFQINGTIISFGTDTTGNGYNELDIAITPSNYINRWCHFVATYTSGYKAIYIDGQLLGSNTGVTGNLIQGNAPYYIGSNQGAGEFFNGYYASFKMYSKGLSATEVQQNYQATKDKFLGQNIVTNGLVLNLDSANKDSYPGTGTTWTDLSGGGYNGTLQNGPTFLPNVNGGIFSFDGTDDYVTTSNTGMLTNGTGNFSYGVWVNFQGKPTFGTIFENGLYTNGMLIRYQANGIDIYAQGGFIGKFTFDPPLNTWNHLSFVRNGNFLDFYINGVYQSAFGFSLSMTYASNLFIGTSQHATTQCFNGYIPVAQIYNRTLSTTEITQNFNAQRNRFGV
jgi:hypothetical protein